MCYMKAVANHSQHVSTVTVVIQSFRINKAQHTIIILFGHYFSCEVDNSNFLFCIFSTYMYRDQLFRFLFIFIVSLHELSASFTSSEDAHRLHYVEGGHRGKYSAVQLYFKKQFFYMGYIALLSHIIYLLLQLSMKKHINKGHLFAYCTDKAQKIVVQIHQNSLLSVQGVHISLLSFKLSQYFDTELDIIVSPPMTFSLFIIQNLWSMTLQPWNMSVRT